MVKPPQTDKEAVDRVIAGGVGPSGRSSIYLWLRQNHARLAPQFEGVRVSWAGVAATMAELGILDAGGRPPKAEAVRRAWWRVRRDVGKAHQAREAREATRAAAIPASILPAYDPPQSYPPGIKPVVQPEMIDGEPVAEPAVYFAPVSLPKRPGAEQSDPMPMEVAPPPPSRATRTPEQVAALMRQLRGETDKSKE